MSKRKKIEKVVDFQEYLNEKLKNPTFKRCYEEHGKRLEVAYRILQLRKQKKLSQAELAKKIGTKQTDVARIESGQQNLTTDTLQRIASALNRELKIDFVR